ncbi:MAG TPA: hypothetical protein VNP98_07675 [Chthoniobacterales bacterium]|nr:hypothetical protein [Chthoniobacterales bacterium]
MSTVDEIANAIKNLSAAERAQLVESIPALLPELDGDAEWSRIINDPTPWPKLEKFLDEIDAQYRKDPEQFPVVRESDFDEKS